MMHMMEEEGIAERRLHTHAYIAEWLGEREREGGNSSSEVSDL